MHTPAEEIGLASGRLGARLRAALLALAPERLRETLQAIREDARRAMLLYLHEGHPTEVRILPAPLTLLPEQLRYLHVVALTLHEATRRMLPLWLADANVRSALPVSHGEEGWIRSC